MASYPRYDITIADTISATLLDSLIHVLSPVVDDAESLIRPLSGNVSDLVLQAVQW